MNKMRDKKYVIMKEVQANSITQAVKKESRGVIVSVYQDVDQTDVEKKVGFENKVK